MNSTQRSSASDSSRERWQLSVRVGLVAGLFVAVACAVMAWNYSRRLVKDPLETPAFQRLKAELAQTQKDEHLDPAEKQRKLASLKEQIRAMDLQLRTTYFRQRHMTGRGTLLLLIAALLVLLSVRSAATLRRRLPMPTVQATAQDPDAVGGVRIDAGAGARGRLADL